MAGLANPLPGLLSEIADWYNRNDIGTRLVGGGVRGAGTRGLLGMEAPKEATPIQREVYDNAARAAAPALGAGKAIFIGAKAANWNKANADKFVLLEKQGVGNREAFAQTGTFRSPDGLLRQEIDDKSAFFPGVGLPDGREYDLLGRTLYHPQQRKAYPDLSDTLTQTRIGETRGSYTAPVPRNSDSFGLEEEIVAQAANRKELKPTLLHEMQHAIQEREGFAKGGNPTSVSLALGDMVAKLRLEADELHKRASSVSDPLDRWEMAGNANEIANKAAAIEARRKAAVDSRETAFNEYRNLAGEAESRAVEARMNYTPEQRRSIFPLDDYDVPLDQLIVRGQSNGPAMSLLSDAPQAQALETARKNAVTMLGLPENNTAMDRAKATGYLDDTYHGTFSRFDNFDLSKANPRSQYMPGVFTADDPRLAENFGDYIMPLLQRKGTTVIDKRNARNAGQPLPEVDTIHDKVAGVRVTNKPENIRSRFAAFDPARINENNLLASRVLPFAIPGGLLMMSGDESD